MKKAVWSALVTAAILVAAAPASAQNTDSKSVNVTVNVNARAKLTLSANAVTFNDADPDTVTSIVATAINVDAKIRTTPSGASTLTVVSDDDLLSGTDVITVDNLTWTAGGSGFVAGVMDKNTAQSLGAFTGSGNHSGTQTYALANSWSYATGSYTATITYTLTAP